jgi:hypothetical protein
MSPSRRRVSRVDRDGTRKGRTADRDMRRAVRLGRSAARRGLERWCNPFTAKRAVAWTYGFNLQHTKTGACDGCPQCGVGTAVPIPYAQWVRQRD